MLLAPWHCGGHGSVSLASRDARCPSPTCGRCPRLAGRRCPTRRPSLCPRACPPDPDDARDEAKVGAYPFTTIDPNVGRAFALLPDPAPLVGLGPGGCGWPGWG